MASNGPPPNKDQKQLTTSPGAPAKRSAQVTFDGMTCSTGDIFPAAIVAVEFVQDQSDNLVSTSSSFPGSINLV